VIKKLSVLLRTIPLSHNDCELIVHVHMPLSPSSIVWYWQNAGDVVLLRVMAVLVSTLRVATHLENLEKSGNSKVVREKSGKMEKVKEKSGKHLLSWTLNELKS